MHCGTTKLDWFGLFLYIDTVSKLFFSLFFFFLHCRLDAVQTIEQLKDVYSHFTLYYGKDIPDMHEANKKKHQEKKELEEGEEDKDEPPKIDPPKLKKPRKRDLYTICQEAGKLDFIFNFW